MSVAQSNLRGALLALAAFGLYAVNDVIVKYLGSNASYHPFQTIFFSGLLSFPLMTIVLMSDRSDGNLIPKMPGWTALRAVLTVLNGLTGFYAFSVLPLSEAYPIFFAMPMLVTLIAIPMLGEKVGLHRGLAVVVGLAGVVVVVRPGSGEFGLGHVAALGAAALGAMNSELVRKTGHAERSAVIMLYPMIANFLVAGLAHQNRVHRPQRRRQQRRDMAQPELARSRAHHHHHPGQPDHHRQPAVQPDLFAQHRNRDQRHQHRHGEKDRIGFRQRQHRKRIEPGQPVQHRQHRPQRRPARHLGPQVAVGAVAHHQDRHQGKAHQAREEDGLERVILGIGAQIFHDHVIGGIEGESGERQQRSLQMRSGNGHGMLRKVERRQVVAHAKPLAPEPERCKA